MSPGISKAEKAKVHPNIYPNIDTEGLRVGQHTNVDGPIGVGQARALPDDPGASDAFYGPWRSQGLRVELQSIRGVTAKNVLNVPFRFQVPPMDQFRLERNVVANDYQTIEYGTYTDVNGVELATVSFETLFTIEPAAWVIARGLYNPTNVTARLNRLLEEETPMRLVAWHPGPLVEVSMPVTFRSLGKEEREPDSRYVQPSFTEWRDPVVQRRDKKEWPQDHDLKAGDDLASLANQYWGKPSEARWLGTQIPYLNGWGIRTPIVKNKHYNAGDTVEIPEPPEIGLDDRIKAR